MYWQRLNLVTNFGRYSQTPFTVPFNNMWTLTAFFATINQMFRGTSQLLTTAEHLVMKSLSLVQTTKQCSAVVRNWEEPPDI